MRLEGYYHVPQLIGYAQLISEARSDPANKASIAYTPFPGFRRAARCPASSRI